MNPLFDEIRAVFLDAVGTLIVPEPPVVEVYSAFATRHGLRLRRDEIGPRFRQAFRAEEEFDHFNGWRCDEARESRRWHNIVQAVFRESGPESRIERCFADLYAHFAEPTAWRLTPRAGEVVAELATRGYILGVGSNFDRRLHSVLDGIDDLSPLQLRAISSVVGWRKPHPRFFSEVVRLAGCEAGQILFVGDSRDNDYDGANGAGLRGVLIEADAPSSPEDRHIGSLTDLL